MPTTFYSTQMTTITTTPATKLARQYGGGVELYAWDYTPPASSEPAATDSIELTKIPSGVMVVQSFLAWAAQDSGATLSLGITGTVAKYMAAQTMTSAGVKFGPTLVAEANLITTTNETALGTLATAGLAATTGLLKGWFLVCGIQ